MLKTFLLTIVIVVAFMAAWELYIRGRGFSPTYNDDKILWANKRREAYNPLINARSLSDQFKN